MLSVLLSAVRTVFLLSLSLPTHCRSVYMAIGKGLAVLQGLSHRLSPWVYSAAVLIGDDLSPALY